MSPAKKPEPELVNLGTPDEYHQYGNSFDCTWPEQGIRMELTRLAEEHGDVTGYVEVLKLKDGKPVGRIGWEKLNLTSSNRRQS